MKHEMTLGYNTDDDGIHLWCPDCGTDVELGFSPTIEKAAAHQEKHLEDVDPPPVITSAQRSWTDAGFPGSPPV